LNDEHLKRRKNVFQGDSYLIFDKNPEWRSKYSKAEFMKKHATGVSPDNIHVPIPWKRPLKIKGQDVNVTRRRKAKPTETLVGKVDLKKIRDIR